MKPRMYLALDIGGTKTDYLFYEKSGQIQSRFVNTLETNDFNSMEHLLNHVLADKDIALVIMGVAGPVSGSFINLTNVPWKFDIKLLEAKFNCKILALNDVEAIGYAIPHLSEDAKKTYKEGTSGANQLDVIISVGTGLGVSISDGTRVYASEAGHVPFWLNDPSSLALIKYLQDQNKYISFEQVCSAIGISNIVKALEKNNFLNLPQPDIEAVVLSKNPTKLILENLISNDPNKNFRKIFELIIKHLGLYVSTICYSFRPRSIFITGGIGRVIANHYHDTLLDTVKKMMSMKNIFENVSFHGLLDEYTGLKGVAWFGIQHKI